MGDLTPSECDPFRVWTPSELVTPSELDPFRTHILNARQTTTHTSRLPSAGRVPKVR
jgi:hypothetical protein